MLVIEGDGKLEEEDDVYIIFIHFPQPERIGGSIYAALAEGKLGLDPEVGAVAVGFDREFSYDKLVRAVTYLANPECLFIATNTDEKYMVTGTPLHLPGDFV